MAFKLFLPIILIIASFFVPNGNSARDLPWATAPQQSVVQELQAAAGGMAECWNALTEITSCSNEIIGFFLNGQAQIDEPCCKAIGVIAEHCGLALIGSLGFTTEEGNLLEGYCEKAYGDDHQDGAALPILLQAPTPSTAV